jgi:hypothetical protein
MGYYCTMCWKCGAAITADNPIGRTLTCDTCGADVRSCRNCRFYSPGSYHDCAERVDAEVSDKERANFCEMFQLNPAYRKNHQGVAGTGSDSNSSASDDASARSAFDRLFDA